MEVLAALVRANASAVSPGNESGPAFAAQANRRQQVLRLVALPRRSPHVVLQLRHRGPPSLFADNGLEGIALDWEQLTCGVLLDVSSVKRIPQQVANRDRRERRSPGRKVAGRIAVLADAAKRQCRRDEKGD